MMMVFFDNTWQVSFSLSHLIGPVNGSVCRVYSLDGYTTEILSTKYEIIDDFFRLSDRAFVRLHERFSKFVDDFKKSRVKSCIDATMTYFSTFSQQLCGI